MGILVGLVLVKEVTRCKGLGTNYLEQPVQVIFSKQKKKRFGSIKMVPFFRSVVKWLVGWLKVVADRSVARGTNGVKNK